MEDEINKALINAPRLTELTFKAPCAEQSRSIAIATLGGGLKVAATTISKENKAEERV